MMNNIEILAPVGNVEALKAAVLSGADAVYFGMGNFNARRNAQNFSTDEEIKNAIEYCHRRGVKVHITLNTLIKDAEIKDAIERMLGKEVQVRASLQQSGTAGKDMMLDLSKFSKMTIEYED